MNSPPPDPARTRRGRWMLIALFLLFFGSVFGAGVLRFSGWQPASLRNHGQLLQPAIDARAIVPQLADGGEYHWNPNERIWRIVLAPPADCTDDCMRLAQDLDKVWRLFGHNADDVQILWIGEPPAGAPRPDSLRVLRAGDALAGVLPGHDDPAGVPVYVIDPNGFVVLRYAPGFDPAGLRSDVSKLLKLM
jgi:cytochrome oxidase Cu insertion factor (SCO1/SenC/PrrC family)